MSRLMMACVSALCLSSGATAIAQTTGDYPSERQYQMVDGIRWSYVVDGGSATVFGSSWLEYDDEEGQDTMEYEPAIPANTRGAIAVPSVLGGYGVTAIGDGAFTECEYLTSVTVPSGVTRIGEDAFSDCERLTSVSLPEGVVEIGGDAFDGCESLSSISIPGTVTSIGRNAFADCGNLRSIYIPPSVKTIGYHAFARCTKLSSIKVPAALASAVESADAFYRCRASIEYYGGSSSPSAPTSSYKKAQTLTGVAWLDDGPAVLSIKVGKMNKKGYVSVGGYAMGVNGKKLSVKSAKLKVDEDGQLQGSLMARDGSSIDIVIDGDEMHGVWKGGEFSSGGDTVGGLFENDRSLTFYFENDLEEEDLPDGTIMSLLPEGEDVYVKNGKPATYKAASVKWARPKPDMALEIYDETSGKGLVVDTSKDRTNLSALKFTYAPKTGLLKGSFKIYAIQNGKLKKLTSKIAGIVVNGTGFGFATIAGRSSQPVQLD